jgi:hypothetical protein
VAYADCTTDTVVLGFIYVVKCVAHIRQTLQFSTSSRHCILLTCLWRAVRYLEDRPPCPRTFAATGGVSTDHLLAMERDLLKRMDFRLYVTQETFDDYKHHIRTWDNRHPLLDDQSWLL